MIRRIRMARRAGFTLIEIMVVVVILGLLAALVVPHIALSSTNKNTPTEAGVFYTL